MRIDSAAGGVPAKVTRPETLPAVPASTCLPVSGGGAGVALLDSHAARSAAEHSRAVSENDLGSRTDCVGIDNDHGKQAERAAGTIMPDLTARAPGCYFQ